MRGQVPTLTTPEGLGTQKSKWVLLQLSSKIFLSLNILVIEIVKQLKKQHGLLLLVYLHIVLKLLCLRQIFFKLL